MASSLYQFRSSEIVTDNFQMMTIANFTSCPLVRLNTSPCFSGPQLILFWKDHKSLQSRSHQAKMLVLLMHTMSDQKLFKLCSEHSQDVFLVCHPSFILTPPRLNYVNVQPRLKPIWQMLKLWQMHDFAIGHRHLKDGTALQILDDLHPTIRSFLMIGEDTLKNSSRKCSSIIWHLTIWRKSLPLSI